MPTFQYEARNLEGQVIKGRMEAATELNVTAALRQKNYFPMSVKQNDSIFNLNLPEYAKVPIRDISIFCRQFSFIISAGIPILRALEIVKDQTENSKLRKILNKVFEDVQIGKSLSDSMKEHKDIPFMLSNMISVGELSGNLDNILIRMADYYDRDYKQNQKVRSALTYPAFIAVFAIVVVVLLVVKVLPNFVGMIADNGGELPVPTKMVLVFSSFLKSYGILILALILALIFIVRMYIKKNSKAAHSFDKFKLSIPLIGKVLKKIITARFARTFGTLMASGVPLITSIENCTQVLGNSYFKEILSSAKEEIKKGNSLGETLEEKGVFPLMLTQMIKIGEESGTLDSILEKTAEFYDSEVETATQQLTTMIEPLIIVVLAVVVGFIILAMIMPMFSLYNSINM